MTERLYYTDSFVHEFEAHVVSVRDAGGRFALTLDRSAFYPSSGGQNFDTGWIEVSGDADSKRIGVAEVIEDESTGEVLHVLEFVPINLHAGAAIRGIVDAGRRLDHMQQHSGQHVLSAAFEKLYGFATVSFHMGEEFCTIDLATLKLSAEQMRQAERRANQIIAEDRPVEISFVTVEEAKILGIRKLPPAERERLRLINISGIDLNACGGTHVRATGQIGGVLLRKAEKSRQGMRVEFVCGTRAVAIARHDFETLTEAAALFSTNIYEVPTQIRKLLDENKTAQKAQHRLLEEVAELQATRLLQAAEVRQGQRLVVEYLAERDLAYLKMLAQKLTKSGQATALLGCGGPHPALVFAQTHGSSHDMGAVMKQVAQSYGIRGGGTRDMAQGQAADAAAVERALHEATSAIG